MRLLGRYRGCMVWNGGKGAQEVEEVKEVEDAFAPGVFRRFFLWRNIFSAIEFADRFCEIIHCERVARCVAGTYAVAVHL
jgi:hypothetical protein